MNVFRKNKKKEQQQQPPPPPPQRPQAVEVVESASSFISSKPSKKNKKVEEETTPEFDLSNALPSTDDFRTSLLMPKLSARFSMLREQDDPDTKVGKASDDSVLFPKRVSRLNLFGHNSNFLSDIDEVSIDGRSLGLGRTDSFASGGDGYGTDDDRSQAGSIMSRGRRTEGNNLFGGRQKVYKIPIKSSGTSPNDPGRSGMGGRAVYEHDVALSAFQRLRLKEKEERAAEEAAEDALSRISSAKRTTYSSTASGPYNARTSTAATSIDEQPFASQGPFSPANETQSPVPKPGSMGMAPERGSIKTRRLYGQGLAQNQQSSAMHRLESLSRQRAGTPELPQLNRTFSRSATHLHDRLQKLASVETAPTKSQPISPPYSTTSPSGQTAEGDPKELKSQPTPPLSPPISENEEGAVLAAALQPEDRGKATAMGLFNKPASRFDEQQFTRRQLQMHQGRDTPPPRRPSPPPPAPAPAPASAPPGENSHGRPRGLSHTSYRSRAGSDSSHYSNAASRKGDRSAPPSIGEASPARHAYGTFLANFSGSESDDDGDDRYSTRPPSATSQGNGEHAAYRPGSATQYQLPEVRYSDLGDLKPIEESESGDSASLAPAPEKPDSPTLGPSGLGLSGLIRTHLRHDSDKSSIYPPPSPGLPPMHADVESIHGSPANRSPMSHARSSGPSQPWDRHSGLSSQPEPPTKTRPLNQSSPFKHGESSSASRRPSEEQGAWNDELKIRHRRDGSTETQKEREEFANELAERRKKVQEKLKSVADSESRSSSPVPGGRSTPDLLAGRPGNAFSLLKNKSGKSHLLGKPEPKSMKVLGLGNASTPALIPDDPWREEEEKLPFSFGKHSNSSSPQIAPEVSVRSRVQAITRANQEDSRESSRSRGESPHSSLRSQRDRSGSDGSGRSKSRTRYRDTKDDLETVDEGAAVSLEHHAFPDSREARSNTSSVLSSARPSVEVNDQPVYDRSSSAASGRYRSGSRSGTSGYFDKPVLSQPAVSPMMGVSPRPSPIAPYSANATPPLYELSPDPSTASTHSSSSAASHTATQRAPGNGGLHKRLIDKTKISEPTFVSSTSNVPLVGLPPGASLSNGMETPPIPPMNPRRRRQTTTQTILNALKGERHESHYGPSSSSKESGEEQSTFSDDGEKRTKPRHRLRKTSSEGGNLNAKARQEAMAAPSPAIPHHPQNIPMEGGMF